MTEYDVRANDFLKKTGTKVTISRVGEIRGFPFDPHDTMWHYKYQVTLSRSGKQYRFMFYDSNFNWKNNKRPTRYDVLASLQKYEVPADLKSFAEEFGYDLPDMSLYKAIKFSHEGCMKQYSRLLDMFGEDLMAELREIE